MALLESKCEKCDGPLVQISLNKVWFCYRCSRSDVDKAWRCAKGHVLSVETKEGDQQIFTCSSCSFRRGPVKKIENIRKAASKSGTN